LLLDALQQSGYLKPRTAGSMTQKIRRMVRRLGLSQHDATLWQGMIRQVLWKVGQP
jgi:tRNA C32,U32 (ribose-2'-O)-methylase TrmJ